jgi:predicted N-formylglutamate amidohydrolase
MSANSTVRIAGSSSAPIIVTCEHASAELPEPWRWHAEDAWLVDTHWAYDLGAAALATALAARLEAPAVLAGFSRLLVDPNRPPESPSFIRTAADGRAVKLNENLTEEERARRTQYWTAYHEAVARTVSETSAPVLFAVHTFTPHYPGEDRDHIEVGVLFDSEEELAHAMASHIARAGWLVHLNEPYSGKRGLIYAVDRHARAAGRRALEIELRQDLAKNSDKRNALADCIAEFSWPK